MRQRLFSFGFIVLCLLSGSVIAQNLLNNPESVVYDVSQNRYLVSNIGSGNIVHINEDGSQEYFVEGENCRLGLHIVGDILFSACREVGVKGFNLQNGELVHFFEIRGAQFLNDVTADTSGNIYVSDSRARKIYRINPESGTYSLFAEERLQNPNGLHFDAPNNRLLVCSTRDNSPIQAISLVDSSVTTIVNTTLDILDGFTQDSDGYYYISSWGSNSVYRFETDFSSLERHSQHEASPADIFFDKHNEVLAVPIFYGNEVEFLDLPQDVKGNPSYQILHEFKLQSVYPNPFNSRAIISFSMPLLSTLKLNVYNSNGQIVDVLLDGEINAGEYKIIWDASGFANGLYFVKLADGQRTYTQKIILMR